jgi:hypothetical protein
MKTLTTLLIALAACGGSPKPAPPPPAPAPVAAVEPPPAAKEPEPPPAPPPPSLPGWYADADLSVTLADDGAAIVMKKGKATKGTWDATASTLTLKGAKATPVKLDGSALVVAIGGAEKTLPRQPTKFAGTNFANEKGSLQLNEDGTCIHGQGGIPAMCTYALVEGKLTLTYTNEPKKKPAAWVVWFDDTNKIMHTPKETFTATE